MLCGTGTSWRADDRREAAHDARPIPTPPSQRSILYNSCGRPARDTSPDMRMQALAHGLKPRRDRLHAQHADHIMGLDEGRASTCCKVAIQCYGDGGHSRSARIYSSLHTERPAGKHSAGRHARGWGSSASARRRLWPADTARIAHDFGYRSRVAYMTDGKRHPRRVVAALEGVRTVILTMRCGKAMDHCRGRHSRGRAAQARRALFTHMSTTSPRRHLAHASRVQLAS